MKERNKRCLDILVLFIIASMILVIGFKYTIAPFANYLNQQNSIVRFSVIFLISTCVWGFIHKTGGIRITKDINPKNILLYPSIWLLSVIFVLLIFAFDVFLSIEIILQQQLLTAFCNLSMVLIAGVVVAIIHFVSKPNIYNKYEVEGERVGFVNILKEPEKIIKWVNIELPIYDEAEDLFNHKYIAQKIEGVIREEANKNIGIVGGYGSGKSSIINLIISQQTNNEIFCRIEGWGFKEETSVEHILQLVLEELKCHFDCLAIANLPKQYHEAMNNSGNNLLSVLGCFVQGSRSPIKILTEIDTILEYVNQELIIVLEDIDRNNIDATFCNEIASFLNVTKELNHVSFILAVGQNNNYDSILAKLCEHREYLQRIDKKEIISICDVLTDHWHSEYDDDIQIQSCEEIKSFLGFPKNEQDYIMLEALSLNRPTNYVSQLLDTPRKLKIALREMNITLKQLHGEIDFNSLFLLTVIKTVAPEAYKYINKNIKDLRKLHGRHSRDNKEELELLANLTKEWEMITKDVSWQTESVRMIICVLFPKFKNTQQDRLIGYLTYEKTLQGILDDSVTDYWKRINVGRLLPDEISDQSLMKTISGWRENHLNKGYVKSDGVSLTFSDAIIEVGGLEDKVEQFGLRLEAKEIRELASELFEKALRKECNKACHELCPGFINLWRVSHKKEYSEHEDWLVDEIEKALDNSLHFTNDLYYFWKARRDYDVQAKTPTPELRSQVVEAFQRKFESNPEALLNTLSQDNPWGVYHMVFLNREGEPEDWKWLGDVLLDVANKNQKLMASSIACLISKSDMGDKHYNNSIQHDVIKEIFGDNIKAVMELLSEEFEYPELADNYKHGQTKSVISDAREEARIWIAEEEKRKAAEDKNRSDKDLDIIRDKIGN